MTCFQKNDIESADVFQLIQNGIQYRFEMFKQFEYVRVSGIMVWKALIKKLNLKVSEPSDDSDNLDFKEYPDFFLQQTQDIQETPEKQNKDILKEQQYNNQNQSEIQDEKQGENVQKLKNQNIDQDNDSCSDFEYNQNDDDDSFEEINIKLNNTETFQAPKYLYDCYLGLQSSDSKRVEVSLKHLNYLIRQNLDELDLLWEDLAGILLRLHGMDEWSLNFDMYRTRALVALSILKPMQMSKVLMERFFNGECSLGDRHYIVSVLKDTTIELSDNPKKYLNQKFNEYSEREDSSFYFQKNFNQIWYSLIINKEQNDLNEKQIQQEKERQKKLIEKSKRWGHTKIQFQLHKDDSLQSIKNSDLLIVKPNKEEAYINRFNQLVDSFFFSLLVPLRTNHYEQFKQYTLLQTQILQLITGYVEHGKNSLKFYNMVEEALEYILKFHWLTDKHQTTKTSKRFIDLQNTPYFIRNQQEEINKNREKKTQQKHQQQEDRFCTDQKKRIRDSFVKPKQSKQSRDTCYSFMPHSSVSKFQEIQKYSAERNSNGQNSILRKSHLSDTDCSELAQAFQRSCYKLREKAHEKVQNDLMSKQNLERDDSIKIFGEKQHSVVESIQAMSKMFKSLLLSSNPFDIWESEKNKNGEETIEIVLSQNGIGCTYNNKKIYFQISVKFEKNNEELILIRDMIFKFDFSESSDNLQEDQQVSN